MGSLLVCAYVGLWGWEIPMVRGVSTTIEGQETIALGGMEVVG